MEFHGTRSAPISMTRAVPWNSMEFHGNSIELWVHQLWWHEQFHGIPRNWNLGCANFADTSSFLEFHRTWSAPISLTRAVPWNYECANFDEMSSSMEFHGIPWNFKCAITDTSSSMAWNSIELGVRQFRWHEQFHGIPWNSVELQVRQFHWHEQLYGIPYIYICL